VIKISLANFTEVGEQQTGTRTAVGFSVI